MGLSHLVQLEKITCQLSDREVSYIYLYILPFFRHAFKVIIILTAILSLQTIAL